MTPPNPTVRNPPLPPLGSPGRSSDLPRRVPGATRGRDFDRGTTLDHPDVIPPPRRSYDITTSPLHPITKSLWPAACRLWSWYGTLSQSYA
jgi:hypothetical protein